MSELISQRNHSQNLRRNLLANVSVLALLGTVCASPAVLGASPDVDHPTVWIELGGQLERVDTRQTLLSPTFFDLSPPVVRDPMIDAQRPSRYSPGIEGKISFAPEATNWVLSASIRYGQSKNARHLHYQSRGIPSFANTVFGITATVNPHERVFGDGQANFSESHFVLDFQAGKDVGLGVFGSGVNSVVSAGVRYAQFTSGSDTILHARPIYGFSPVTGGVGKYHYSARLGYHHTYTAVLHTKRNTHAVGPAVSWEASARVLGGGDSMAVALDWGVNAAVLFGRQRTMTQHQTTGYYFRQVNLKYQKHGSYQAHPPGQSRSRSVTIPNVGGFAGVSLKFPSARISFGYRGDFFLGATDNGIDTRHEVDQNFYGPFATVSIGLGG